MTTRSRPPKESKKKSSRSISKSEPARAARPFGVALGSNLGPSPRLLRDAIRALESRLGPLAVAPIYLTEAVTGDRSARQPDFLNTVVTGRTRLSAEELLAFLLRLERRFGRRRDFPGAPRTLDLDLLYLGRAQRRERAPLLPHPRLRERRFVLQPLADVAPDLALPPDGATPLELLATLPRRPWVRRFRA